MTERVWKITKLMGGKSYDVTHPITAPEATQMMKEIRTAYDAVEAEGRNFFTVLVPALLIEGQPVSVRFQIERTT